MKTFIMLALAVLLAGCATRIAESPPAPPLPIVPMPPTPMPLGTLNRQSVRGLTASSVEIKAQVSGVADTNSPNYGVTATFPTNYDEDVKKGIGVYVQWNNWPVGQPYVIQRSTNMVDWTEFIYSVGDNGRVLVIFDLEHMEFYRIVAAISRATQ